MEELKKLLAALEGNLDPKLATRLLDTFEILDKEHRDSVLDALREGVAKKKVIVEYQQKREDMILESMHEMKEIEDKQVKAHQEAAKKYEETSEAADEKAAEAALKEI